MKKTFFKHPLILLILTSIASLGLMLFLYEMIQLERKIEKEMFEISTSDITSIAQNNAKFIHSLFKKDDDYVKEIIQNSKIQKELEEQLEILITNNIQYAYILYRDSKGVFRFLADASPAEQKAILGQKFDIDSQEWLDIFDKKEPITIRHDILQNLSISYLVPILSQKKVELILVIDFSVKKLENINSIIGMMKNAIISMITIILIFIIILFIQVFRFNFVKKTSYIDKLTNVHNRNFLEENQQNIDLNKYTLAELDIDFFKHINDTYGHDAGDVILKQVAEVMKHETRDKDDFIIRYGGEEFLILIKKAPGLDTLKILERILQKMKQNKFHTSEKCSINLTVSIGVNLYPQESKTFFEALKLADIALYNAKNSGRDKIEVYSAN